MEASASAAPSTQDLTERSRRLLASAPGVLLAYLYGSHARGRAGPARCPTSTSPYFSTATMRSAG